MKFVPFSDTVQVMAKTPLQRTQWVLECGCEPMVEHCTQCDHRREVVRLVRLEELVERSCRGIYADFDGYWPSDSERARIASALAAHFHKGTIDGTVHEAS